ncbi:MAG: hypothetical protein WCO69_00020 [Candidatus Omnitrophota bacterium]
MIKRRSKAKGFAVMEYILLLLVIIGGLTVFRGYFQRAYYGQMATTSETFAYGRQYSPDDTIACAFDDKASVNGVWYSEACYDHLFAQRNCKSSGSGCGNQLMLDCTAGCFNSQANVSNQG